MAAPTKKTTPRKAPVAKKAAAKKTAVKKAAVKKTVAKKTAVNKAPVRKTPIKAAAKPSITASDTALNKKQLIERVVERSGLKKKDAKPAIEATLAILGEALEAGEEMNLQPFGKVMIKREIDKPNAHIFICRIRRRKENKASVVTITPKPSA